MSLEIYLVRHGQTEFNRAGLIQGWIDSPLTTQGRQQAIAAGEYLHTHHIQFDAAFCSTSQRAIDTAQLILDHAKQSHLRLQLIEQLREYHFGAFEGGLGSSLHDLIAKHRGFSNTESWLQTYQQANYNMFIESISQLDPKKQAENESDFLARLYDGLHHVLAASPSGSGRIARILLVSHGMSITTILKSIDPDILPYRSVPNGSISVLRYSLLNGLKIINVAKNH